MCIDAWMDGCSSSIIRAVRACVRLCPLCLLLYSALTVYGQSRAVLCVKNAQGREKVLLTRIGGRGMVPGGEQTDRQTDNNKQTPPDNKETSQGLIN
jgi:hypothetical protein